MVNPDYPHAIINASRKSCAVNGLSTLATFSKKSDSNNALNKLPKPKHRESQKLLAGILLRAGDVEQASKVLVDVDAKPDQFNASDALIIDPGLVHFDGHHYNSNVFYKRLIEKSGLTVKVLRSMSQHPSLQLDETNSIRTFALSPYEKLFPATLPMSGLNEFNELFLYEFLRTLPKVCPRLLVVHTARHTFIEGFCRYLKNAEFSSPTSVLIGIVETDAIATDYPQHEEIRNIYHRSFALLKTLPQIKILVIVETDQVADYLNKIAGDCFEIKVMSYVAGYLEEIPPVRVNENTVPVVGFVGQTRPERGAFIIPEIAKQTLMNTHTPCRWRAQLNIQALNRHSTPALSQALDWLKNNPNFKIISQNLSLPDYYQLLAAIDIMVMPYSTRYNTTGSGVAIESLKFGHIQVVPEHSSMARIAKSNQTGFISFSEPTPKQVSNAIIKALEQLDLLRPACRRAAKAARLSSEPLIRLQKFFQNA